MITEPTKRRAASGSRLIATARSEELVDTWRRRCREVGPVFLQERPEDLVEVLAVAAHRAPEDPFLHGADLPERAVGAAVLQQHSRFEAMGADAAEGEGPDEMR